MVTIAHIINPVKVDRSSDLFIAQPIVFETMRTAAEFAKNDVALSLFAAQFPEDADFVPVFLTQTENLDRSILDLGEFNIRRKLPHLKDILDRLFQASDAEYFIYTNSDIALVPSFYSAVKEIISRGYDAFVINRRTIPGSYSTIEDIPLMTAEVGEPHKGFDCFVFKREFYPDFELGRLCVGIGAVGRVLVWNMVSRAVNFREFKNFHLTFHIGNDRIWLKDEYSDYTRFNREEALSALKRIDSKFNSIEKLRYLDYLGTFDLAGPHRRAKVRENKFVFLSGLHRSGTTLLADCLKEHPLISGFADTGVPKDEGQFLQSVFPPARQYGGPGVFGFNDEMHLTERSPLATGENGEKIFDEWGRFWDTDKPLLLEKSPPNLLKTRFLQALFPNSYFIVITRHPAAVSYATMKWSKTGLDSLLEHWAVCHDIFESDKPHLRNVFMLKYEDFVKNPDAFLKKIYNFLGIPYHPYTQAVREQVNRTYLEQWREYLNQTGGIKKWRMYNRYRKIETIAAKFGYSLYNFD